MKGLASIAHVVHEMSIKYALQSSVFCLSNYRHGVKSEAMAEKRRVAGSPCLSALLCRGHEALWTLTQLAANPSCNSQHPVWLVHSNKSWNEGSSSGPLGVARCSEFRWLEQKPGLKPVHHNNVRAESNYNLIYKDLWALFSYRYSIKTFFTACRMHKNED